MDVILSRLIGLTFFLFGAQLAGAQPIYDSSKDTTPVESTSRVVDTSVTAGEMRPFAEFLNEVSERRRRVVYIPNQRHLSDGALVGLVHAATGSLSLKRRDMVVVDRLPVSVTRIFASDGESEGDFGASLWQLGENEFIESLTTESAFYRDSTGGKRSMNRSGDMWDFDLAAPTDIFSVESIDTDTIEIRFRSGLVKTFSKSITSDRYWLIGVTDRYGNAKYYYRDPDGILNSISTTGGRLITIVRDASGRIDEVQDDQQRTVEYFYDAAGQLETVQDLGGFDWTYAYESGLLSQAYAPGNLLDLDVRFFPDGRVRSVSAHDLETTYAYDQTRDGWDGVSTVAVTDPSLNTAFYGQAASGITTHIDDGRGHDAFLEFGGHGLVHKRFVNGNLDVTFTYEEDRLKSRVFSDSAIPQEILFYDETGRLSRITDQSGDILLSVGVTREGFTDIADYGKRTRFRLSNSGDLVFLERNGFAYRFGHNALGQVDSVTDAKEREATLEYFSTGQLESITYPDSTVHSFTYNDVGLRDTGTFADGLLADYDYSPDGSLLSFTLTQSGEVVKQIGYAQPGGNQLQTLSSGVHDYVFSYDALGNPRHVSWARGDLDFEFDQSNRFYAISDSLGQRWVYPYTPNEIDLRMTFDMFTQVGLSGRIDLDDAHTGVLELVSDRVVRSAYGPIGLNVSATRFDDVGEYGVAVPGYRQYMALSRARFFGANDTSPTITEANEESQDIFAAPSNILFIPSEFWSVNCNICPPDDPHSVDPSRADQNAGLQEISDNLERCPFIFDPPPPPPPLCPDSISVTGPSTFMSTETVSVTASLSPGGREQEVVWTITPASNNFDAENVSPSSASGPNISFRAAVTHAAYGTGGSFSQSNPVSYELDAYVGGSCDVRGTDDIDQDTDDVIRQEYRNHNITVPSRANVSSPTGTANFSASSANNSAYSKIVGNPAQLAQATRDAYNSLIAAQTGVAGNHGLVLSSGWRNPERNEAVGGARSSSHQYGNAVDLVILGSTATATGLTTAQLWAILEQAGDSVGVAICENGPVQVPCNDPGVDHVHVQN